MYNFTYIIDSQWCDNAMTKLLAHLNHRNNQRTILFRGNIIGRHVIQLHYHTACFCKITQTNIISLDGYTKSYIISTCYKLECDWSSNLVHKPSTRSRWVELLSLYCCRQVREQPQFSFQRLRRLRTPASFKTRAKMKSSF